MRSTEQGNGCTTQHWRRRGAEETAGAVPLGSTLQGHRTSPSGWPHSGLMYCTPISSWRMGDAKSWCIPPHLAQQEFHSCALRAPYAMNPSTVSEDKWRVLWKGISTTAIDPPKFYHSTRWGLLITLAGRNMTWKMWHSCYEPFYIRV